jgi:hypothetical protein
MLYDAQTLLSDAQALTATANSANVYDCGSDRNIGIGEALGVRVTVDVAADGTTGDETYTVKVVTDDNAALSSATDVTGAVSIPRGSAAGSTFIIPIPPNTTMERYIGLTYTLGGTTPTVTVTAAILPMSMIDVSGSSVYYAAGYTVG